jgi:type II secretory pathway component PulM
LCAADKKNLLFFFCSHRLSARYGAIGDDTAALAQAILSAFEELPRVRNEVYVQLVNLTTDIPAERKSDAEPLWACLNVVCAAAPPTTLRILCLFYGVVFLLLVKAIVTFMGLFVFLVVVRAHLQRALTQAANLSPRLVKLAASALEHLKRNKGRDCALSPEAVQALVQTTTAQSPVRFRRLNSWVDDAADV